jgi:hypothetical protein
MIDNEKLRADYREAVVAVCKAACLSNEISIGNPMLTGTGDPLPEARIRLDTAVMKFMEAGILQILGVMWFGDDGMRETWHGKSGKEIAQMEAAEVFAGSGYDPVGDTN